MTDIYTIEEQQPDGTWATRSWTTNQWAARHRLTTMQRDALDNNGPQIRMSKHQRNEEHDMAETIPVWAEKPYLTPTRAHPTDAGLDLRTRHRVTLRPGKTTKVPTGVKIALPEGTYGQVQSRSSLAVKGVGVLGGVIDANYRGEIQVVLINHGREPIPLDAGNRIAQLIIHPIHTPSAVHAPDFDNLPTTDRGTGGFGSTGKD